MLNSLLQKAHDGSTVDQWWWYLATSDYRVAPHRKPDGTAARGTQAPINPSFVSPFIGDSLEDVAHWLMSKPQSAAVDDRFFGVLDKQAEKSGKIAICRLNDPKVEKEVAWCILRKAEESTLFLGGLDSDLDWDEMVQYGKYVPDI